MVERAQVLKERNMRNTKKESAQVLFDFYCEVTKTSDTQLGKRTFQDSYFAASTIDPAVLTWLGTVFSTDEYKAFSMAQFSAMHSFKGAPFGWDKIHLEAEFQVGNAELQFWLGRCVHENFAVCLQFRCTVASKSWHIAESRCWNCKAGSKERAAPRRGQGGLPRGKERHKPKGPQSQNLSR
jgi:hypothetical protein